jgi:hypothetical protein
VKDSSLRLPSASTARSSTSRCSAARTTTSSCRA